MINWNTDEVSFKKNSPKKYKLWRLTQLINYGLDGEKLDKKEIIDNWDKIKDELDIDGRKTLEFLLWGKKWKGEPGLRADRMNFLMWLRKRNISRLTSTSQVALP